MKEFLQKYAQVKFLTSIDLRSSYWQIPLNKDSTKYKSFLYNGRSFTYQVLPFGLKTVVASIT